MCKIIYTKRGRGILVDDEDYEWLDKCCSWHLDKDGYARGSIKNQDGKFEMKIMHRLIMGEPQGVQIDHINGNRIDNRKENLRYSSNAENMRNSRKPKGRNGIECTSEYKGVTKRGSSSYECSICINNVRMYLGTFDNEIIAANVYNYYAKIYHKDFALLNKVKYVCMEVCNEHRGELKKSKYGKGVNLERKTGKFIARISNNGIREYLGFFNTPEEAQEAYVKRYLELKEMRI